MDLAADTLLHHLPPVELQARVHRLHQHRCQVRSFVVVVVAFFSPVLFHIQSYICYFAIIHVLFCIQTSAIKCPESVLKMLTCEVVCGRKAHSQAVGIGHWWGSLNGVGVKWVGAGRGWSVFEVCDQVHGKPRLEAVKTYPS